jgi:hypothetical protein
MPRSIELNDEEIEIIEEALGEMPTSDTLTALKAKLVRAAEPAAEATHAQGDAAP